MYRYLRNKVGQNTAEYAILIGVIVAAVIAMQLYVRRGMQARIKDAVDYSLNLDDGAPDVFKGSQYEPYYYSSDMETTQDERSSEGATLGGGITRATTVSNVSRIGTETYGDWNVTP